MPRSQVDQYFDRAFAKAYDFYETDEYDKAITEADDMLSEQSLPRLPPHQVFSAYRGLDPRPG
jgi:hypothetical protein